MKFYKKYLSSFAENSGWVLWSMFFFLAGLITLVDPQNFSSTLVLDAINLTLIRIYGGMMLLGGLLKLVGTGLKSPRIEQAGVALVMPALIISVYIFITNDYNTNRTPSIILYCALGWALITRYIQLGKAQDAIDAQALDQEAIDMASKILNERKDEDQ